MLTIEFAFPAGRYHATPWGNNVNEGFPEWPPSPYRIARALIDLAHRRRPDWDAERLSNIVRALQRPLEFALPRACSSHIRNYLSSNTKDSSNKQKIFDAFVAVNKNHKLFIDFDAEDISPQTEKDLGNLLGEMNYLGRSESWVIAQLTDGTGDRSGLIVSRPISDAVDSRQTTVRLACLKTEEEYGNLSQKPVVEKKKKQQELSWLEALSLSTKDLLRAGWSHPPAQSVVRFGLPEDALRVQYKPHKITGGSGYREVLYRLHSTVLPRVQDTVLVAERARRMLMGIHRKVCHGDAAQVSTLFSGKDREGKPLQDHHNHAYFLPLDCDSDGQIDHLLICAKRNFDDSELCALDRFRYLWQSRGRPEVAVILSGLGRHDGLGLRCCHLGRRWKSVTPFVTSRHYRRGRGSYQEWLEMELRRESRHHGLPEPRIVEFIKGTPGDGLSIPWELFSRSRKGCRPMRGHGFVLEFKEDVRGPFALGTLAHYGLGVFSPSQ